MSTGVMTGEALIPTPDVIQEKIFTYNRTSKILRALLRLIDETAEDVAVDMSAFLPARSKVAEALEATDKQVKLLARLHRLSVKTYLPDADDDDEAEEGEPSA